LLFVAPPSLSPPRWLSPRGFFVSPRFMDAYLGGHQSRTLHDPDGLLLAGETELAKKILFKLWSVYPKRDWKVHVDIPGGICAIKLPRLHHSALGFNFPLDMLAADPAMLIVTRAGGELLERLNLSRGRFSKAEMVDRIQGKRVFTKNDFAGQLAIDHHATVTRKLIVPEQHANADIEAIKGRGLAQMALERAQAAARPVLPSDLEDAIRVVEAASLRAAA